MNGSLKKIARRTMAIAITGAVTLSSFSGITGTKVLAGGASLGYWPAPLSIPNQFYYQNETLQPYGSCFLIDELKNWSPDNDPDARYNRSAIPLKKRWMGPSVNPNASRDAKVMPLAMSNARASESPSQGGNGDFVYAFNNFQYVENYNFWGGSSGEGPIAIPSPEHIDSAHRNGVRATGTIFIPWGDETYGGRFVREMLEKDSKGNYICADKLIEIAEYYGFDGYIFNAESGTSTPGFKDFLAYMQKKRPNDFTIAWYNGSGSLGTGNIKSWMQDGDTPITNEWWLDMGGSGYVDETIDAAAATGVDKWNIYSSWEYWPMSNMPGTKGGNYQPRLDKDGKLKISLGILAPTVTLTQAKDSSDFQNVQDQKLWVGPKFDPSSTYRPQNEFCGFANMVADRTPVLGTDFSTTFTTGNGYKFYEDGKITGKQGGWYNRSLTDVLPTWRWIVDSEGKKLSPSIDYNDAWWGGTSMKVQGALDAGKANHIKLYSTHLDITKNSKFSITYKTSQKDVKLSAGLCFGDTYANSNFKFYPVSVTSNGEWNTATVDLSGDAGKTAIALSLKFESNSGISDYSMNIGRMAVTTKNTAPSASAKVTLDEVIYPTDTTMEARVYWQKAKDASRYVIHRVHADGHKEFIGATPSDALYLGSFNKEKDKDVCKFEITSYNENGVKGGTNSFEIKWPKETKDAFGATSHTGQNLALGAPAVSSVRCVSDGPVDKINDGVIGNSKWCSTSVPGYAVLDLGENKTIQRWIAYHANARGAGEGVDMNTVDFDFSYAPDDGKPVLTGNDYNSKQRVRDLKFTEADTVRGNKQSVTDRNLDKPIQARYVKLNITRSDSSAWHAIRVYEFQVYENPGLVPVSAPSVPLARSISIKNNVGAADTVQIDNVGMQYTKGTYGDRNGVIGEKTGVVNLYDSMSAKKPIASIKAVQPDESYKQRQVGVATFEKMNLNPDGGRLFYEVMDESSGDIMTSPRFSVEYAPESGKAISEPTNVTLKKTVLGKQLRSQYGKLSVSGLPEGAELFVYPSDKAISPILRSMPVQKGTDTVSKDMIPLNRKGGKVYYEIHLSGHPDSKRYEFSYGDCAKLMADMGGLQELVEKCNGLNEKDYVTKTFVPFAQKLSKAQALLTKKSVTAEEAESARASLAEAKTNLRKVADAQRVNEICKECKEKYTADKYSAASFKQYEEKLNAVESLVKSGQSDTDTLTKSKLALEKAITMLVVKQDSTVTDVVVSPKTAKVAAGSKQTFKAEVKGTNNPSQSVTWKVKGNKSKNTTISDGILNVDKDETAKTLTVLAVSLEDSSKIGKAEVEVATETQPKKVTISISPKVLTVDSDPGQKGQFTATVTGDDNVAVNWSISGNTSKETLIANGQLFLGTDETAETMTVTAVSAADSKAKDTATVKVVKTQYPVRIEPMKNGTVTFSPKKAAKGEKIMVKAIPAKGYRLQKGSLTVNGKAIVGNEFIMSAEEAVISAKFEELGNTDNINALLKKTSELKMNDYTAESWNNLMAAVAKAKSLAKEPTKAETDAAEKALTEAFNKLTRKPIDKKALVSAIEKAESIMTNQKDSYKPSSMALLEKQLAASKAVLSAASSQKAIDTEAEKLNSVISKMALKENNKDLLNVISKAEQLNSKDYTSKSYSKVQEALNKAKDVATNAEASREEIDNASTVLKNAVAMLEKAVADVKPEVPEKPVSKPNETKSSEKADKDTNVNNKAEKCEKTEKKEETTKSVSTGDAVEASVFAAAVISGSALLVLKKKKQ